MTKYQVGYDAKGRIVCVTNAPETPLSTLGPPLDWIEIENDEMPELHGKKVVGGVITDGDPIPVQAPQPRLPTKEEFLDALYQKAIGNDAPMSSLNMKISVFHAQKAKP